MALFEKYLFIKKSKLPKAGKGLFTKIEIPKGKRIVEYKGKLRLWKDVKHCAVVTGFPAARALAGRPPKKISVMMRVRNEA